MSLLFNLTLNSDGSPNKLSGIYLKELKLCVGVESQILVLVHMESAAFDEGGLSMKHQSNLIWGWGGWESIVKLQETVHIDRGEVTIYVRSGFSPGSRWKGPARRQCGSPLTGFLQGRLMLPFEM